MKHNTKSSQCLSLFICKIAGNECWKDDINSGVSDWMFSVLSGELRAAPLWGRIARQIKWSNNVPESQCVYFFMFHAFASLAMALESVRPLVSMISCDLDCPSSLQTCSSRVEKRYWRSNHSNWPGRHADMTKRMWQRVGWAMALWTLFHLTYSFLIMCVAWQTSLIMRAAFKRWNEKKYIYIYILRGGLSVRDHRVIG